ncbi:glycosyltransferase family 1 protein [soil metagenome]
MFWSASSGGVRRYLLAKQAWLERRGGWRHTIAAPVCDNPDMARVPAIPLPGSGGYRLPLDRGACTKVLTGLQFDIIEAGDPYRLAWSALDASQALSAPAVAFAHSNLEAMARRACGHLGERLSSAAARAAGKYVLHLYGQYDLVLAPSHAMRNHLLALGLRNVERQPLGVDSTLFNPALHDPAWRRELRASLELAPGTHLLLYVGRFAPEKNLQVLTDAVARLGKGYALLAVGAGPTPPRGDHVRVRPYEADRGRLARLLANVDALVHAGDQETFGLAVLEAMASGTPVIARASDGLAELVDEEVGAGVPSLQPDAFAEAIAAVCQSDGERSASRALAARRRARKYDWERVFPQLFSRYAALMHGPDAAQTIDPGLDSVDLDSQWPQSQTSLA